VPEYYTKLIFLWENENKEKMYAVMAKHARWFLVERSLLKRTRFKTLYTMYYRRKGP
jgi:hypothetical protein